MPRQPNDPEWSALIEKAHRSLPSDGDLNENENMVDEWKSGRKWAGVSLNSRNAEAAYKDAWLCKIYIGGAQRVIGRGTLYQCARQYDCARVWWKDYRTDSVKSNSPFNFSRDQAYRDAGQGDFFNLFAAIDDYFKSHNIVLLSRAQRDEGIALRRTEYQHNTRTATGRIETRLTAVETHVAEVKLRLNIIEQSLSTIATQLALLLHRSGCAIPVGPESAELLNSVKNNLTSVDPSGSLSAQ